jgi:hypothetical protein
VQNSEEYEAQGLLIPAAEEHYKAAEAFQVCFEQATDEQVSFCAHEKKVFCSENAVFSIVAFSTSALCECSTTTNVSSTKSFSEE